MIKLSWPKLDTWNLDDLGVEKGIKSKCEDLKWDNISIKSKHIKMLFWALCE